MNVMKLIYSIFYLSLFMICATSCGKEDSLVPNETQKNYFIISPDATDPVSVLRREFRVRVAISFGPRVFFAYGVTS